MCYNMLCMLCKSKTDILGNNQGAQRRRTCGEWQESVVGKRDEAPSFIKAVSFWLPSLLKFHLNLLFIKTFYYYYYLLRLLRLLYILNAHKYRFDLRASLLLPASESQRTHTFIRRAFALLQGHIQ